MYIYSDEDDFDLNVRKYYNKETKYVKLSDYKDVTIEMGVYAIYYEDKLKKIGKAGHNNGVYHRLYQYYEEKDGINEINADTKDLVYVKYFLLNSNEETWIAERRLQVLAYDSKEPMDWEKKK